jgi:putative ABC transport system permease protein
MFRLIDRLTAIAVRLHEPELLPEAERRLQSIPGAQVATFTEMTGVFLNMVGSVRILLQSVTLLAVSVCLMGVFNTMLAAVLERATELAVMRALGASRAQMFAMVTIESLFLAILAAIGGWVLAATSGGAIENFVRPVLPLVPSGRFWSLSSAALVEAFVLCLGAGFLAGLYPAWRASRIQPALALKPE